MSTGTVGLGNEWASWINFVPSLASFGGASGNVNIAQLSAADKWQLQDSFAEMVLGGGVKLGGVDACGPRWSEALLPGVAPLTLSLTCSYSTKNPSLQSETVHYKRGVSQQFSLPSFKIDFSDWKDEEVTLPAF